MKVILYINYLVDKMVLTPPLICEDMNYQTSQDYENIEGIQLSSEHLYEHIAKRVNEMFLSVRTIPIAIRYEKNYQTPNLLKLGFKKISDLEKHTQGLASISVTDGNFEECHVVGFKKIRGGAQGITEAYSLIDMNSIEDLALAIKKAVATSIGNYKQ
jgi:hypothetical protein